MYDTPRTTGTRRLGMTCIVPSQTNLHILSRYTVDPSFHCAVRRRRTRRLKDCSIEFCTGCTCNWIVTVASTGACSMSMARTSVRIDPRLGQGKKGRNRTGRPRPGTIPRRLWFEASSCDRWWRHPAGRVGHRGTDARVDVLRGVDGHGAHWSSSPTRCGCRRQGIQLSKDPFVAASAFDRSGHPDAK